MRVTKIYPPLKLRIFVDDITALPKVKNSEVVEMAKKVMKNLKEEVDRKGFKLSVTENGKEGKSKMITSCSFLDNEMRQYSKEEGVTMTESVERKKCKVRFSITKKNKAFQRSYMKVGVKKWLRAGMVPARTWGAHAVGMSPTERLKLRRQMAAAAGKKSTTSYPCSWKHMASK